MGKLKDCCCGTFPCIIKRQGSPHSANCQHKVLIMKVQDYLRAGTASDDGDSLIKQHVLR
jgi:hypothetical protein